VLESEPDICTGWAERIHPDDVQNAGKYYNHAVETGSSYPYPIEMRLLGPGNAIVDITYELQAEKNATGDCIGFVGVFSDVSNLRKLERERVALEKSRREEAETNRQLQEHFIDVSRQPSDSRDLLLIPHTLGDMSRIAESTECYQQLGRTAWRELESLPSSYRLHARTPRGAGICEKRLEGRSRSCRDHTSLVTASETYSGW
jgi:hypothetical protein